MLPAEEHGNVGGLGIVSHFRSISLSINKMKRTYPLILLLIYFLDACDTYQFGLHNTQKLLTSTGSGNNANTNSGNSIMLGSGITDPCNIGSGKDICNGYHISRMFRNNLCSRTRLNLVSSMPKSAFTMDFDVEEDDDDDFDDYAHDEVTYRVRSGDVQHIPQAERYSTKDWIHNLRTLPTSRLLQRIKQVVLYNLIWSTYMNTHLHFQMLYVI